MSYDTGRSVDSSILETLMSKPLSISSMLLSSQNSVGFDGNLSITEPYLHEDEDYQEHFNLLCFLNQESSNLQNSATNLIPTPSCFTESTSNCSHSSTSWTNPYLSSISLIEQHAHVDISFLHPQPHILEQQEISTENLPPISVPSVDINFQLNGNADFQMQRSLVIPQDILVNDLDAHIVKPATVPCTSDQIDLQTELTQSHQIAISNKDLKIKEIEGANQETLKFSCTFANLSDVHRVEVPKPRIRWNPELHECFVQAVDDLGGPDSATPRSILIIMGVDGLTIDHVKSHLQKYRHNKYPIVAKGEKKSSCMEEKKNEKENKAPKVSSKQSGTLNMQWELQKSLHDQLKIIRELQLQTEENGRRLQEFMETQNKMQEAFVQATQSLSSTSTVNITERISAQAGRSEKHKGNDNTEDCFIVDPHIEYTQTSHKRARLDT